MTKYLLFTTEIPDLQNRLRLNYPQFDIRVVDETNFDSVADSQCWFFIDWLMPEISGLEFCRRLRAKPSLVRSHITIILEDENDEDRRLALRSGADDYLVGPLTYDKLHERLALYGEKELPSCRSNVISCGDLQVDYNAHCVRYRGKLIAIAPNEFELLAKFLDNVDQLLSRHDIIGLLGKDGATLDERTVDVWVGRLRRTLRSNGIPPALRSVRKRGYVWDRSPMVELVN